MVKITVVKTTLIDEFVDEVDDPKYSPFKACSYMTEGQEFIFNGIDDDMPKGFCDSAWIDIYRYVMMIEYGAEPEPRLKNPKSIYACCTEGLRPVVFKLEKIE